MPSRRQNAVLSRLPRECMSRYYFENLFHVCKASASTDKSVF